MNPEPPQTPASSKPGRTPDKAPAAAKPAVKPLRGAPPPPPKVAPLFRRLDWLALLICLAVVETIYLSTLAPELGLEDSGELLTGSFWAGIPHPPGYPFWAIYSWLWTELVPFGNVAFRVELGQAAAMGFGCSLIALMVSRGSSMLMEGIEELKGMVGKWESAICLVCGVTAGLLMALDNVMWKESVIINRASEFGVPWLILVLLCMMRWIYAPHQRGYLYCAFYCLGICSTIHQTLIVALMGVEVGVACTQPKLGRDLFLLNTLGWLAGLGVLQFSTPIVEAIFNVIGIASLIACLCLTIRTMGLLTEWKSCVYIILLIIAGCSFYFYEAIAGMTDPPMEWGYPRTVQGFFHALTRGQYEKINPTNIIAHPDMFMVQLWLLVKGVADAFNWVYMFFAALPFLFITKMQRRERNWLITVAAIYPFLGVLLTIFLNPQKDRQSVELLRVFFAASHSVVAIMIGYGLALTAAYMATHYEKFRRWAWLGGTVALVLGFVCLWDAAGKLYLGFEGEASLSELPLMVAQAFAPGQYGLPIYAGLILIALPVIFLGAMAVYRARAPLLVTLGLFAVMPVCSGLSHWYHSEQRGHWFGYWFGHDMFTPPFKGPDGKLIYDAKLRAAAMEGTNASMVYPEMAPDTVLYGGTDPGRFCPTYMIYCDSFIPPSCLPEQDRNFSRRDVYLITQNAVADPTYLDYIRSQYNRSQQIDPPFFQMLLPTEFPKSFHQPTASVAWLDDIFESIGAKIEWRRRTGTSFFKEDQFKDVTKLAAQLCPHDAQDQLSKYLYGKLSRETQGLVTGQADSNALGRALARDLNRILTNTADGPTIYTPERFKDIKLPPLIEKAARNGDDQTAATKVRLNRRMLEEAYPDAIVKSLGGVYPDTEILEPSPQDSQEKYNDFYADAQRRAEHDKKFPSEPRQVRSDETITTENGQMQVTGQGAVMKINGLLTQLIFERNPDHEFYVEESFPLEWMYQRLTPFGIIMKVNRQPVPEITEEMAARDHQFWKDYSQRLIGDWINYDTSVKDICDFCGKVYVKHDYSGFQGDPKFVRDEDAQKSFSKLRNAIGASIYMWRAGLVPMSPTPPVAGPGVRERMVREAEFALKQSFVYCPYSPEAVYHLMLLYYSQGRLEDLRLILKTAQALDPHSGQFNEWLAEAETHLASQQLQREKGSLSQAQLLTQQGKGAEAEPILDGLTQDPHTDLNTLLQAAVAYVGIGKTAKGAAVVRKLTETYPNAWEIWFYLARMEALDGKAAESAAALEKSFAINSSDLVSNANQPPTRFHDFVRDDKSFDAIRQTPEYQKAMRRDR
jgi:tetratricopeptide (TPR) repeat protein